MKYMWSCPYNCNGISFDDPEKLSTHICDHHIENKSNDVSYLAHMFAKLYMKNLPISVLEEKISYFYDRLKDEEKYIDEEFKDAMNERVFTASEHIKLILWELESMLP